MSGAVVLIVRVSVLLAALLSCVAPVVPVTVLSPAAVGVPATAQVTVAPAGTGLPAVQLVPDGLMVQVPAVITPVGNPVTPHCVPAPASALPMLVQLKLPL